MMVFSAVIYLINKKKSVKAEFESKTFAIGLMFLSNFYIIDKHYF